MNLLLDTHTLIWFFEGATELSEVAKSAIIDENNTCFVSILSFWEIAIKLNIGKLQMNISFEQLRMLILENGFEILPLKFEHTKEIINLPLHHRDPFDRLIISQATVENMIILSRDENFKLYNVKLIW